MNQTRRYVKVEKGSKKPLDAWKQYKPDKSASGDWEGRTYEDACSNGDNVAFMTGWGVYVVDVDTKNGDGIKNWEIKKAQYGMPDTFTVKTPSGGYHYYYAVPENAGLRNSAFWGEHIDSRADGGYVLYPPSSLDYVNDGTVTTKYYEIVNNIPMAHMPESVLYQITEARKTERAKVASFGLTFDGSDNVIVEGTRDDMLIRLAGRLVNILPFPSVEAVSAFLRSVYFGHCENPTQEGWARFVEKLPAKVTSWIDDRKRRLEEKKLSQAVGSTVLHVDQMTQEYLEDASLAKCFPTLIRELDECSNGGPKESDLGVVVARTKVGKTSTLLSFVYNWAAQGFNIMFLEMEMQPNELLHRLMARHTGVSFWDFERKKPEAKKAIHDNLKSFNEITKHIHFVCEPVAQIDASSVKDIVARQEYLTGKRFDIVVIDYAGQLEGDGDEYWVRANSVALHLRAMSLETKKFVIAAVQSNREKDGKDIFSSMAGGDGLARAATWELFIEAKHERVEAVDDAGEKIMYKGKPKMITSKNLMKQHMLHNGVTLMGVVMKLALRGRNILGKEIEVPFAHSVCGFNDAAMTYFDDTTNHPIFGNAKTGINIKKEA